MRAPKPFPRPLPLGCCSQDYEPAWADVDEAWNNVIGLPETVLIDRRGLGEQGSKRRGGEGPP
eukprot:2274025-Pyramimonas_sp.AAC.1